MLRQPWSHLGVCSPDPFGPSVKKSRPFPTLFCCQEPRIAEWQFRGPFSKRLEHSRPANRVVPHRHCLTLYFSGGPRAGRDQPASVTNTGVTG